MKIQFMLLAGASALLPAMTAPLAAGTAVPRLEDVPQVRVALNSLTPAELASISPRVTVMLDRWFPKNASKRACDSSAGWLSSDAVCEWYAPGADTSTAVFPDMFIGLSARRIDSVVLWGTAPLRATSWKCVTATSTPVASICVPKNLPSARQTQLIEEWKTALAQILPSE